MSDDDLRREERLAAWLDGAMPPEDAKAFADELDADPALAQRAASWRANDRLIAGAFAPVAARPLDDTLLAQMGLGAPAAPLAANDNPPWWRRHAVPLGGAIAASLAMVLLLVPREAPVQQDPLSVALETAPSGTAVRLADGRSVTPVLTARAADGRWCREYRIDGTTGLACRNARTWKIEAQGAGEAPAPSGEIVLAGGEAGSALDAAHARLGTTDPVNRADEQALIHNNWGGR